MASLTRWDLSKDLQKMRNLVMMIFRERAFRAEETARANAVGVCLACSKNSLETSAAGPEQRDRSSLRMWKLSHLTPNPKSVHSGCLQDISFLSFLESWKQIQCSQRPPPPKIFFSLFAFFIQKFFKIGSMLTCINTDCGQNTPPLAPPSTSICLSLSSQTEEGKCQMYILKSSLH